MNRTQSVVSLLLTLLFAPAAFAQTSSSRAHEWEGVFDVNYQDSYKLKFEGGSTADAKSDWGLSVGANYHYNDHLQLQFLVDWMSLSYKATIQSGDIPPRPSYTVSGDMDIFTPKVNAVYNFMPGPITPYVSGGIGWSFIDTNIPQGPPQTGCWWDPWWGYICTTYQNTKNQDAFAYQLGAGVRWEPTPYLSLRFGYEKQWYDVGTTTSTPGFDTLRLGLGYRF
jgi:opacity protein-like surface antigen